jgi:MurNAc alpha-1-phosphate uridylyltransferase
MVLAAGKGTRMRELTRARPKPLLEVAGRALLDHALDRVAEVRPARIVVNVHYLAGQVEAHLAGRDVLISDERAALLETGGGVRRALPLLGAGPAFVVNSDSVWTGGAPLPALAAAWDPARMDGLLLLVPREAARGYTRPGDFFLGEDGRLARRGGAERAPYVYTGAQIVRAGAFAVGPETGAFSANLVWDRMLAAGRLFGAVHRGGWVDVGTPEGLAEAEAALREAR